MHIHRSVIILSLKAAETTPAAAQQPAEEPADIGEYRADEAERREHERQPTEANRYQDAQNDVADHEGQQVLRCEVPIVVVFRPGEGGGRFCGC